MVIQGAVHTAPDESEALRGKLFAVGDQTSPAAIEKARQLALMFVKIALDIAASTIAYVAKVVAGKRSSVSVPMRCAGICATDVYNPGVDRIRSLHGSMAPRVALIAHDTCEADGLKAGERRSTPVQLTSSRLRRQTMPISSIERLTADNYLLLKHGENLAENHREEFDAPSSVEAGLPHDSQDSALRASLTERLEVENRELTKQVEHLRGLRPRGYDVDELCDAVNRGLPRVA
jgi:hypothetical protein